MPSEADGAKGVLGAHGAVPQLGGTRAVVWTIGVAAMLRGGVAKGPQVGGGSKLLDGDDGAKLQQVAGAAPPL